MAKTARRRAWSVVAMMAVSIWTAACGGAAVHVGLVDGALRECPRTPNCVSSQAPWESKKVAPFTLALPAAEAWAKVREAVASMPRTKIVAATDVYLHAECRSAIFRFVDDLELLLDPERDVVDVRSASRVGRKDFGVNRDRVETLRGKLSELGLLK